MRTVFTAGPAFASATASDIPLHLVDAENLEPWLQTQNAVVQKWLMTTGFRAQTGEIALCPDASGDLALAIVGRGRARDRARIRFCLGGARTKLPHGTYVLHHSLDADDLQEEGLGWLLAGYRFRRYHSGSTPDMAMLRAPEGLDATRTEIIAQGEYFTRDLITTPASDMGPDHLEDRARALADHHGATITVIQGEDLPRQNFPLIHAVGRASDRAPRLIDLRWGDRGCRVTLVGKGVCFDTGGLNLKPGASMGLMKKDMGGAATVLGLAHMIMAQRWPVQLRILVPAVENAVAGNAMRPGDVLTSRKGLSVEVNNTDAEGRLVLADALTFADEESPDVLICMATLTGAARVAIGPDIAPFFTHDAGLAAQLMQSGATQRDPVWQLPLHAPYEEMIEPAIADLDNAPAGGMAGAITAALFLHRFVERAGRFVHFDIYGHQPKPAPARPKGGVGQGARAVFDALPRLLNL